MKAHSENDGAATTEELHTAIEEHIAQSESRVSRLEQVFEIPGKTPQPKRCAALWKILSRKARK